MIESITHISAPDHIASTVPEHQIVLEKIRLLCTRRVAWLRSVWSELLQQGNETFTPHMEVDGYLGQIDHPLHEKKWLRQDPQMREITSGLLGKEQTLDSFPGSRLKILARTFGLNKQEQDLLQLCFAFSLDPDLGRIFAYMQDHSGRSYVTGNLAARLFGYDNTQWLRPASPLRMWQIIREELSGPGEPDRIECDPFIKNWLLGGDEPGELLSTFTRLQPAHQPLEGWPVEQLDNSLKKILDGDEKETVRIFVSGIEGSGRKTFSAVICRRHKLRLISVDTTLIPENRRHQTYVQLQRYAFLTNSALAWSHIEPEEQFQTFNIPSFPIQFFVIEPGEHIQPDPRFIDLSAEIPALKFDERVALWKRWVPQSASWPSADLIGMIERYQSNIGQIVSLSRKNCDTISEAYMALKSDTAHRLGKLAQLANGTFSWDDLVVSETVRTTMEDFTFEATERVHFWEQPAAQRLFPQGRSLIALFTGSPGTGKTMAAQVIASSLKLDLFRIDLSAVISKYVGESSKNLERILSKAKAMDIVLLFDEADSLFGKRTEIKDAHDRYANTDTNYLLQAIEQYPGIIILSSNKKSGIDPAFMRRFRYVIDFPKPDKTQRLRLWNAMIQELAGDKAAASLNKDLITLSGLVEMTGAQIKQAVLSSIFISRKERAALGTSHVLRAVEREFMKEGKSVNKELEQHFHHINV